MARINSINENATSWALSDSDVKLDNTVSVSAANGKGILTFQWNSDCAYTNEQWRISMWSFSSVNFNLKLSSSLESTVTTVNSSWLLLYSPKKQTTNFSESKEIFDTQIIFYELAYCTVAPGLALRLAGGQ